MTKDNKRRKKVKGKKSKRSRRYSSDSSGSDSDSSSASPTSGESDEEDSTCSSDGEPGLYEQYDPVCKDEVFVLPKNLDKFARKHFSRYLAPDLIEKMNKGCPLPNSSAFHVPKLEEEWR